MVGKLGFFLMGVLTALLLDPKSGSKRRAALARRMAPLRQRFMAAQSGTTESAGMPAPVTEMLRNVSDVAGRAQDQIGAISQHVRDQVGSSPSEAAGKLSDAAQQVAQRAKEQVQQAQEQGSVAVQQTTQLVHERAEAVAQQAAGTVPDAAPVQGSAGPEADQRSQESRPDQRNQSDRQPRRGRSGQSSEPEQAQIALVTPEDVAPTGQFDPIPEGEPDEAHPGETINDPTLVARIESELYRDDAIPKGALNIDSVHGVVTFRGTVKSEIADEILERAMEVEGVRDIVDLLQRD